MATNLLRSLANRARVIIRSSYIGGSAVHNAVKNSKQSHESSGPKPVRAKSRVKGVQRAARSVTSGTRAQRAKQLKAIRANPAKKQTLRTRAKFYTYP
jgi:hypothetical protein